MRAGVMIRALRIILALWLALVSIANPALATPQIGLTLFGQAHLGQSVIDLNFAKGPPYYLKGAAGPLTESRSTSATCFDQSNNLVQVAAFVPCIAGGQLWSYEARTNSTRNNSNVTAAVIGVIGSGGVLPANWVISNLPSGVVVSVSALPVANGYQQVTLNFNGTPGTLGTIWVSPEPGGGNVVPATYGQTWSKSVIASFSNTTNIGASSGPFFYELNSGGGGLLQHLLSATTPLTPTRVSVSATNSNVSTAQLFSGYQIQVTSGLAVNFNITLALDQLELNPNLPGSVASATVAGGGSLYVGASGTMTYSGTGCTTNPVLNVTTSAGAINAVTSVATAGVCTTLPVAGSTAWTPGGGLSAGSGASFTLTPTNNAAQAFPTPPILTTNAAVTRNESRVSIATQSCANPSLLAIGTPSAPANTFQQAIAIITNGSQTPSLQVYRALGQSYFAAGGAFPGPNTTWTTGVSGKIASSINGTTMTDVFNNGAPSTGTNTALGSMNLLGIGNAPVFGAQAWNGGISRVALACGSSLTGY